MYSDRLVEIGKTLGDLKRSIAGHHSKLGFIEEDIVFAKAAAVPAGGWPGSSEDKRKEAMQVAYTSGAGPELVTLYSERRGEQQAIAVLEADIASFEEERRALEYAVRDRIADALLAHTEKELHPMLTMAETLMVPTAVPTNVAPPKPVEAPLDSGFTQPIRNPAPSGKGVPVAKAPKVVAVPEVDNAQSAPGMVQVAREVATHTAEEDLLKELGFN